MDVTGDTVDADQMTLGTTATKNNGTSVTGTLIIVPVDTSLSTTSENAVQNKVITAGINAVTLTFTDSNNDGNIVIAFPS